MEELKQRLNELEAISYSQQDALYKLSSCIGIIKTIVKNSGVETMSMGIYNKALDKTRYATETKSDNKKREFFYEAKNEVVKEVKDFLYILERRNI